MKSNLCLKESQVAFAARFSSTRRKEKKRMQKETAQMGILM
jgi:hypothetical protein